MTPDGAPAYLERGTAPFRRANWALFLAAFSIFASLYSVQPLLPVFAGQFGLGAGGSSLSLSVTTATLAIAMLAAGAIADTVGRKRLMFFSLLLTAVLNLLVALAPTWTGLLVARGLMGLALSGIPAVAMAYIAEEVEPGSTGFAMGLYIGGTAIGGMAGRLVIGVVADFASWRVAIGVIGVLVLISALLLQRLLPESTHFTRRPFRLNQLVPGLAVPFRDPGLRWLFVQAFLLMGGFITVYNYLGFRLSIAPYALSQSAIALIFLSYLVGTGSSAWAGGLADRIGRRKVLWWMVLAMVAGLALMSLAPLVAVITGVVILTSGFFGAHAIASGWVGRRALHAKAQASSLYLFFYYMGSSLIGTAGGWAWTAYAWPGVSLVVGITLLAALGVAIRLFLLPPLPLPETRPQPLAP